MQHSVVQMNLAHFRKLLPKLIFLTKIQKKTPTIVVFKESFWPEIEIFQPKLLNFFLNYTARDSTTHPQWVILGAACEAHSWLSWKTSSPWASSREGAQETAKHQLLWGSIVALPQSKQLLQSFPSDFEYSVSPPNAQKDVSLGSFQASLQIPKFRKSFEGLRWA